MPISPKQAKKVLEKNSANLSKKVADGKPLTLAEIAMLEGIANGSGEESPGAKPAFAKSKAALAQILGVSRKTIQRYAKHDDSPPPGSNGSYNVAEWRKYLAKKEAIDGDEDADLNQTDLKAKQILLQNKLLEHKLAVKREQFVAAEAVEKDTAALIGTAKRVLLSGPAALAPQVVGVSIPEAEKIMREWLHDALSRLCANPLGIGKGKEAADAED